MKPWLVIGCLAAVIASAQAVDHPVTSAAEFASAVAKAQPGDTITLREGEWKDAEFFFNANGTADKPVTLQAAKPGATILTGQSRLRFGGDHLVVSGLYFKGASHPQDLIEFRQDSKKQANDCRLTQCAIVDCNAPGATKETRWIGLYGMRNRVDHCWIQGKTNKGTTLVVWLDGKIPEHRIDHNYFGPRPPLKKNGGETIRVGDSKTSMQVCRTVVEANCFEQCNGEAEIISNKSCENIYRDNTFLRCSGSLTLRHGNDCLAQGNYFFGEGGKETGGIRVIGERHRVIGNYFQDLGGQEGRAGLCVVNGLKDTPLNGYFPVKDVNITGNTWFNCRQPIYLGQTDEDTGNTIPADGVTFSRNAISGTFPAVVVHTPGRVTWDDNVVVPAAAPAPPIPGLRPIPFQVTGDPVKIPEASGPANGYGFQPAAGSPGPLQPSQTGPDWR